MYLFDSIANIPFHSPALFTKMSTLFSVFNISLAHFLTDAQYDNSKCLKTNSPTFFPLSVFCLILSMASWALDALLHAIITRAPVWSESRISMNYDVVIIKRFNIAHCKNKTKIRVLVVLRNTLKCRNKRAPARSQISSSSSKWL